MMSDCTLCGDKNLGKLVLPHPFNQLDSVWDSQAKGSWVILHISNDFDVSVFKCKPGIRILSLPTYNDQLSMTFIQCPNVTTKSVGFIAIGIKKQKPSTKNKFTTLQPGMINCNTFLCIVQGVFVSPSGELLYIFHKLRKSSTIGTTLSNLVNKYSNDPTTFCKVAFENEPTTALDYSVSFLYFNQIAGPTLAFSNAPNSINVEFGLPFIQARMQPDSWCNEWLSDDSNLRKCIKFDGTNVRNSKCKLRENRGTSRRSEANVNVGMDRLRYRFNDPTDVYYCLARPPMVDSPECKYQLVEYITKTTNNKIFVGAPLSKDEVAIFDEVYQQHTLLSSKEHNALLNSLLKQSGQSKIVALVVTPGKGNTEQVAIVLIPPDLDLPSSETITRLSSRVSKTTMTNLKDGAIEITPGFPIQWIYSWSFKKVMTLDHLHALQLACPHPKTTRTNAECCQGYYQNFGP